MQKRKYVVVGCVVLKVYGGKRATFDHLYTPLHVCFPDFLLVCAFRFYWSVIVLIFTVGDTSCTLECIDSVYVIHIPVLLLVYLQLVSFFFSSHSIYLLYFEVH